MKFVIRADASSRIGTGHVTRCMTLARALQARGAATRFVCRAHQGNLIATVQENAPVSVLSASTPPTSAAEDYADWLGVPELTDADETIAALQGDRPDWMGRAHR